jgi:thymidylate synthase (FAD)
MIKVEMIDYMGSDLTVVNSARVSFSKVSNFQENGLLSSTDSKLINYLAKHKHFTPFTHPQITLRETVPIFVARQRFKHVVGFTYNEISRRYVSDTPSLHIPEHFRSAAANVKQGSAGIHPKSDHWLEHYKDVVNLCVARYEHMIADGVCPEQARMVLPQSMMTSYYVTGSLAAFARLYNQRSDSHAQQEIQDLAQQIAEIIAPLYPISWAALTKGEY